ncbi:hypothetical protein ACJJTC_015439, partial [Scirpophaga incertulas]
PNLLFELFENLVESESEKKELKQFFQNYVSNWKTRWISCNRTRHTFIKKYSSWLQEDIKWPDVLSKNVDAVSDFQQSQETAPCVSDFQINEGASTSNQPQISSVGTSTNSIGTHRKPFEELSPLQKRRRVEELLKYNTESLAYATGINAKNKDRANIIKLITENPEEATKIATMLKTKKISLPEAGLAGCIEKAHIALTSTLDAKLSRTSKHQVYQQVSSVEVLLQNTSPHTESNDDYFVGEYYQQTKQAYLEAKQFIEKASTSEAPKLSPAVQKLSSTQENKDMGADKPTISRNVQHLQPQQDVYDDASLTTPGRSIQAKTIDWNEESKTSSEDIYQEWESIKTDIMQINTIKINRWFGAGETDTVQLHGFSDSSQKAYACVVYSKVIKSGQTEIKLLAGKSRLVPCNKEISLPRLELSGALLLSKLMKKIKDSLSPKLDIQIFGWIDSTAVLGWLQGNPDRWKPFVANRVRQITEVMPPECWQYIKSSENPADCASRGLTASRLIQHPLWWQGPAWLPEYLHTERKQDLSVYTTNEEIKLQKQVNVITQDSSRFTLTHSLFTLTQSS